MFQNSGIPFVVLALAISAIVTISFYLIGQALVSRRRARAARRLDALSAAARRCTCGGLMMAGDVYPYNPFWQVWFQAKDGKSLVCVALRCQACGRMELYS